jgi:hypothetical protein
MQGWLGLSPFAKRAEARKLSRDVATGTVSVSARFTF